MTSRHPHQQPSVSVDAGDVFLIIDEITPRLRITPILDTRGEDEKNWKAINDPMRDRRCAPEADRQPELN